MQILLKYFSEFTDTQLQQFAALDELYKEWNNKINVISRNDINSLYEKHVLHSLSIAAVIDFKAGTQVIDIGTGGGFPGIPLAIYFPGVQFHLVDSIAKKIKVVENITHAINLKNVTTQHIRAEEIRNKKFDFVVSRAVAPLKELWKWSNTLLQKNSLHELPNGLFCLKGGSLEQEIYESGLHPRIISIKEIFAEEYLKEKFLLHIEKK